MTLSLTNLTDHNYFKNHLLVNIKVSFIPLLKVNNSFSSRLAIFVFSLVILVVFRPFDDLKIPIDSSVFQWKIPIPFSKLQHSHSSVEPVYQMCCLWPRLKQNNKFSMIFFYKEILLSDILIGAHCFAMVDFTSRIWLSPVSTRIMSSDIVQSKFYLIWYLKRSQVFNLTFL